MKLLIISAVILLNGCAMLSEVPDIAAQRHQYIVDSLSGKLDTEFRRAKTVNESYPLR